MTHTIRTVVTKMFFSFTKNIPLGENQITLFLNLGKKTLFAQKPRGRLWVKIGSPTNILLYTTNILIYTSPHGETISTT